MNAHTPGPWTMCGAKRGGCSCGLIWSGDGELALAKVTGIDDEQGVEVSLEVQQANARLISAAPDLLEALRGASRALRMMPDYRGSAMECDIQAAIAKAEGKS